MRCLAPAVLRLHVAVALASGFVAFGFGFVDRGLGLCLEDRDLDLGIDTRGLASITAEAIC